MRLCATVEATEHVGVDIVARFLPLCRPHQVVQTHGIAVRRLGCGGGGGSSSSGRLPRRPPGAVALGTRHPFVVVTLRRVLMVGGRGRASTLGRGGRSASGVLLLLVRERRRQAHARVVLARSPSAVVCPVVLRRVLTGRRGHGMVILGGRRRWRGTVRRRAVGRSCRRERLPVGAVERGSGRHAAGDGRDWDEGRSRVGGYRLEHAVDAKLVTICALSILSVLVSTAANLSMSC